MSKRISITVTLTDEEYAFLDKHVGIAEVCREMRLVPSKLYSEAFQRLPVAIGAQPVGECVKELTEKSARRKHLKRVV
jgi:hypothetical protein